MSTANRRDRSGAGSDSSARSKETARSRPGYACVTGSSSASNASAVAASRDSARSTSSAVMLPAPSQIEFNGASRYSRGRPESST